MRKNTRLARHAIAAGVWFGLLMAVHVARAAAPALDFTIQGEMRDRVLIERVAPPTAVELKDVVPFSRLGQTDWVLTEELGYLSEDRQVAMMNVNSPKTFTSSMIDFPKPPFFVQSYPPPVRPMIVDRSPDAAPPRGETESWTFIVIDQNNNLLTRIEGNTVPTEPIQWDGMARGRFVLKPDEVYSSMLIIQESRGVTRSLVGDPIALPALRYAQGRDLIFEFSNRRVYEQDQAAFAPALEILVEQLLNSLRRHDRSPFKITIYDRDLDLAHRRARFWRAYLERALLRRADTFDVSVALPGERGAITQVVLGITQ